MNMQSRPRPAAHGDALLEQMSRESRRFLQDCRRRARVVKPGTGLVGEGDDAPGAVWVLSGRIALQKTMDDGRRVLFDLLLPIDVLHPAAADTCSSSFEAVADATSVVAFFSHEEAGRLHRGVAGLAPIISLLEAAARARQAERMLRIVQGRAEERVAFLLLELALRTQCEAVLAGRAIDLALSQRVVGEMTGLTNVHVCRVMRRLADRAVLRSLRGRVEVRDFAALAALAHADPHALARAILV